jgi:hypothetical protein
MVKDTDILDEDSASFFRIDLGDPVIFINISVLAI